MAPILNFVSDVATPHVNQLLEAVSARGDVDLRPWYAYTGDRRGYSWKVDPTLALPNTTVFGHRPCGTLLARALRRNGEGFMIVGWSNPTTRLLIPLLAARRRRFAFFTDRPRDADGRLTPKGLARAGYFGLLRHSACVFAVGESAVDYFRVRGFASAQLCNLPMPVPRIREIERLRADANRIRHELGVPADGFLVVSGSRLTKDKGFDILIDAVSRLSADARSRLRVLIVGEGPERESLERQAKQSGSEACLHFRPWMDFDEFCAHMSAADLVVHPARFDAFGGITLTAVALGLPVVGSREAGAVAQFVTHGENGYVYDAEDVERLARILSDSMESPERIARLTRVARTTGSEWTAEQLADTLVRRLEAEGILERSRSER